MKRPDEVPTMSKGDRVVTVDGLALAEVPLGEANPTPNPTPNPNPKFAS